MFQQALCIKISTNWTLKLFPLTCVYAEKAIKSSKASGPDGIPPSLKEFAYELSSPLADALNCSFREGVVPHQ